MKDRILPALVAVVAVVVVSSHLVPSLWPSAEPASPRQPRPTTRTEAGKAPNAPGVAMRNADVDFIRVGSIPATSPKVPARDDLTARVVVKADQTVALSAEINARVVAMPLREGDRFRAGTKLVEFDCRRTRAELAAAQAALNLHRNAHDTARQLLKMGAAGVYGVRQAQFEMDKAAADVENLKAKEATCVIAAPFDGVVVERLAASHEVVAPNQPLLRIVDTAEMELQLVVPSFWMARLGAGQTFEVELDENHRRYPARIHAVAGAVDPVSQTVRVLARFDGHPDGVSPGMSGTARFVEGAAR